MSFGMDAHKDSPVQNYGMSKDNLSIGPVMEGPAGRCSQLGGATGTLWAAGTATGVDFRSIHTFMKQYPIKRTVTRISPVRQTEIQDTGDAASERISCTAHLLSRKSLPFSRIFLLTEQKNSV